MPDILAREGEGLDQPSKEYLDLAAMPMLRERTSPADQAMNREQAAAYQAGQINSPAANREAAQAPPVPQARPQPAAEPVITASTPPIQPQDAPSVQKRINKLYGQKKAAEEVALANAERARIAEERLAQFQQFQPPQALQPPAYQNYPQPVNPYAPQPETPADQTVSRAELQAALNAHGQFITNQMRLTNSHLISRREAESDFPDVFSNSELREAADQIWAADPYLQSDPQGPYKAAALARGLRASEIAASGSVPTAALKAQLAGIGPSVPDGSGAPSQASDRAARYNDAIRRAALTGRTADFARARRIQMGIE